MRFKTRGRPSINKQAAASVQSHNEAMNNMTVAAINTLNQSMSLNQALGEAGPMNNVKESLGANKQYQDALAIQFKERSRLGLLKDAQANFETAVDLMEKPDNVSDEAFDGLKKSMKEDYGARLKNWEKAEDFVNALTDGSRYAAYNEYATEEVYHGLDALHNLNTLSEDIGRVANNPDLARALNIYALLNDEYKW